MENYSIQKKQVVIFCLLFIMLISNVLAQKKTYYPGGESALGLRFGGSSGIDFKKYSKYNNAATEIILANNFDKNFKAFGATLLFEKLAALNKEKKMNGMLGFGASYIFGGLNKLGTSGIIGFDWRMARKFNMQVDWQPTFYFTNGAQFSSLNAAFTGRYNLN